LNTIKKFNNLSDNESSRKSILSAKEFFLEEDDKTNDNTIDNN